MFPVNRIAATRKRRIQGSYFSSQHRDAHCLTQIRITVSKMGQIEVATVPLSTRFWSDPTSLFNPFRNPESPPLPTVSIYIDTHPTTPSIFTRTKTTFRELYDQVKTRNQCTLSSPPHTGATTDVLMYNQHGEITETTIFNVAFYRDNQWLTPATSTGCLPGVMRRWLLETGRIQEDKLKVLKRNSIHLDEWLLLFNGVQGCQLGKLRLSVSNP